MGCAVAGGATDEVLGWCNGTWVTPLEVARMFGEYDRVFTF